MMRSRDSPKILLACQIIGVGASFSRNLFLGYALSPTEFGLAATYVIAVTAYEMITYAGGDRFLVSANQDHLQQSQRGVHSLNLIIGSGGAALIVIFAPVISVLLGGHAPPTVYAVLALVPFIRAFVHTDYIIAQREREFAQLALLELVPPLLSLILVLVLVDFMPSSYIMVCALLIQHATFTIITHSISRTTYKIDFSLKRIITVASFGLPLLFDGTLVYVGSQADRAVISYFSTPEVVGKYFLLATFAAMPASILLRFLGVVLAPLAVTAVQCPENANKKEQDNLLLSFQTVYAAAALAYVAVLGTLIVPLFQLFTVEFVSSYDLVALFLVASAAVKVLRGYFTLLALANRDSGFLLASSMIRAASLPVTSVSLSNGYGLAAACLIAIGFECLALLTPQLIAKYRCYEFPRPILVACVSLLYLSGAISISHTLVRAGWISGFELMAYTAGLICLTAFVIWRFCPQVRSVVVLIISSPEQDKQKNE